MAPPFDPLFKPLFDLADLEVLTFGRSSVDLYPEQHNVPLADVRTFRKSIGGSPTNVAVAAARLGRGFVLIDESADAIATMRTRLAEWEPEVDVHEGDQRGTSSTSNT